MENHREIIGNGFAIEFFNNSELSSIFLLSLYGENGIYPLIEIAKRNKWQIYDSGIDSIIDLKNPKKTDLKIIKNYVEKILKEK